MLFGAIRLLEYILLIMEQIAWVSRWFVLKKYIIKMLFFRNRSRNLLLYYVCTASLTWRNRWLASFVDTIYVWKIIWQKIRNLMILDNSGVDYSRMLLFVFGFRVYWKIEPNSRAFSRLRQHLLYKQLDYKVVKSKLSKKQNVIAKKTIFKVLLQ